MEYKIYDYSMPGTPAHPEINQNDLLLLSDNVGHHTCLPQEISNSPPAGFCGGDVKVNVSGHSPSGSSSKQQVMGSRPHHVQKKKAAQSSKHSTTKLSVDPQSVAARQRRHRISKRFRILQTLVPGGTKMDTASMLDEAIHYVKFLKYQIWFHEMMGYALNVSHNNPSNSNTLSQLVSPSLQVETDTYSTLNAHSLTEADTIAYVCGQSWGSIN